MDEDDIEVAARAVALVAAFAEADLLDDDDENEWEKVSVHIEEYLLLEDPSFRRHFRFTKPLFETLCEELHQHLIDTGTIIRERTDFRQIMLMVLWILATPDTFRSVALRFGVHPGEVHDHYKYCIEGLREMGERYITWPDAQERQRISRNLERISGFPGIVGMIDGKHFSISKPVDQQVAYRNRHHGHSILAQAVCDDRLLIRDLYVGEAGSLHDARVFRRSPLCMNILRDPGMFSGGEHIIGDSAYMLLDRVITPFENNGHLAPLQRNFNRRLSKVRVKIENSFGQLTTLWRRSKSLHIRNMDYAVDHIAASFVLHNFRIIHGVNLPDVNEGDAHVNDLEDNRDDPDDPLVQVDAGNAGPVVDDDPHVPQAEWAHVLRQAELNGEQKRWDLCNNLPNEEI